jgi:tetratricopeptide (TPR) repeat protein
MTRRHVRIALVLAVLVLAAVVLGLGRLRPPQVPQPGEGAIRDADLAAAVEAAVGSVRSNSADAKAWAALAMTYDANELPALASRCYAKALELDPGRPVWWYGLGVTLERQDRYDDAVAALQKADALSPRYAPLHCSASTWALTRGRLEDAEQAARRAISSSRGSVGGFIALGRVQLERGSDAEAAALFRKALAEWPSEWGDAAYARFLLGTALQRSGRQADAAPYLAGANAESQRLPDPWRDEVEAYHAGLPAHVRRARAAAEAGRFAEAIAQFRELRRKHPDNVPVAVDLSSVLVLDRRHDEAIAVLREVVASNAGAPEPAAQLVSVLSAARRHADAVQEADRAVSAHPASAMLRAARGAALLESGDAERALADFVEETRLAPASAAAHTSVGAAQLRLRRIDEAQTAFEEARRRDARHTDAIAGLARDDKATADARLAEIAGAQAAPGGLVERARVLRSKLGE